MKIDQQSGRRLPKRSGATDHTRSLELLREANAQLERFFASFSASQTPGRVSEMQLLLELQNLLEQLTPVLQTKELQGSTDVRVQGELAAYARNLLRLRGDLAAAQASAATSEVTLFAPPKRKSPFPPPKTASSYDC